MQIGKKKLQCIISLFIESQVKVCIYQQDFVTSQISMSYQLLHAPLTTFQSLFRRLSEPRLSEAERQACEAQWADRSLFVTELLLSTLLPDDDASASSSEDEDDCHGSLRNFADFEAMGCVEVMTLDVALENLNLKEMTPAPKTTKTTTKPAPTKKEPPAPPL